MATLVRPVAGSLDSPGVLHNVFVQHACPKCLERAFVLDYFSGWNLSVQQRSQLWVYLLFLIFGLLSYGPVRDDREHQVVALLKV